MVRTPTPDKPILGSVVYARDEVNSEPVVMGALTGARFRRPDGKQVSLPFSAAERLKDFETGLRLAGLVGPFQCLVQTLEDDTVFTVQNVRASIDLGTTHVKLSKLGFGAEAPSAELLSPKPLVKGTGERNRLGDELRALSAKRAAKPRT